MEKLSVVVITFNEENNIFRCINSVKSIADEVVVIDSNSTDNTAKIAAEMGAKVINQPFLGYTEQKNFAVEQAKYSLVLSVDADEAPSDELIKSIQNVKENPVCNGYIMNRLTNYCGTWIKHCGWYPDKKLRLFFKDKGKWVGGALHEKYELFDNSKVSFLKGDLLHYSYNSIEEHINQVKKFTAISAKELSDKGYKPSLIKIVFSSYVKFFRDYILKLGFLDGFHGYQIAKISAFATYLKYARTRDYNRLKEFEKR